MEANPHQPSLHDLQHEVRRLREQVKQQSQQLAKMETTLQELVEIALLPVSERPARAEAHHRQKLAHIASQIQKTLAAQHFDDLESLIDHLQTSFPDNPQAEEIRLNAWAARDSALAEAITHLSDQIDAMMSASQWQAATDAVTQQIARFGHQPQLVAIRKRIEHEYHAWRDSTVSRIYTQARQAIDRREWRRALKDAEELTSRFSDHPRAMKIIQQLPTLRENAEIQHRQELERDIQQFIRTRRFDDAIAMAEELIRQYPHSPQATECRALIPKLEAHAMQDEMDRLGNE